MSLNDFADLPFSVRDYYYYFFNPEDFPEARQDAKTLVNRLLQSTTSVDPWFTNFRYTKDDFHRRMHDTYVDIMKQRHDSWLAAGRPLPIFADTKEHMLQWLANRAPFHYVDGAWLRSSVPTGPINVSQAKLLRIYADELGNGDVSQNHCNLFEDLIRSVGLHMPAAGTRAFVDSPQLCDSAFLLPVFILAISLFPRTFAPEILGLNLAIEWNSTPVNRLYANIIERYGGNALYYTLHASVDNVSEGHGKEALEAIDLYLDTFRAEHGEHQMQQEWQRIWRGYVVGSVLPVGAVDELTGRRAVDTAAAKCPRSQMIEIIKAKASVSASLHAACALEGRPLDEWFSEPEAFVDVLARSRFVEPGQPERSPFLAHLTAFDGPMFAVFSKDETRAVSDWIMSLAHDTPSAAHAASASPAIAASPAKLASSAKLRASATVQKIELAKAVAAAAESLTVNPSTQLCMAANAEPARLDPAGQSSLATATSSLLPASNVPVGSCSTSPESRMIELIKSKAKVGSRVHKTSMKTAEGSDVPINELFSRPRDFLTAMVLNGWTKTQNPACPDSCRLMELTRDRGSMARVFNDEEKRVIRDWVLSVNASSQCQAS